MQPPDSSVRPTLGGANRGNGLRPYASRQVRVSPLNTRRRRHVHVYHPRLRRRPLRRRRRLARRQRALCYQEAPSRDRDRGRGEARQVRQARLQTAPERPRAGAGRSIRAVGTGGGLTGTQSVGELGWLLRRGHALGPRCAAPGLVVRGVGVVSLCRPFPASEILFHP